MNQITATKRLTQSGGSLVINVTKEAQAMGLSRGDYIEILVKPAQIRNCDNCGHCKGWIDEGYGMGEYDCDLGDDCPDAVGDECPAWKQK